MKRLASVVVLLTSLCVTLVAPAQMPIGTWRDCLDNTIVYHLQPVDNYIFAASRGGVYRYNLNTTEADIFSKSKGLSDVGFHKLSLL